MINEHENYDQNNTSGSNPNTQPPSPENPSAKEQPSYGERPTAEQPIYASSNPQYANQPHSTDNLYGGTQPRESSPNQTPYGNTPPTASRYNTFSNQQGHQAPPQASQNWNSYQQAAGTPPYGMPPKPQKKPKAPALVGLILAGILLAGGSGFAGAMIARNLNPSEDGSTVVTQSLVNSANDNSDVSAVAASTMNSVVEITTEVVSTNPFMQQYVSEGAGSGVIISKDGYIVTNNHVIDGATKVVVRTKLGETYEAKIVGADPDSDLAVLKIEAADLNTAVYGDSDQLTIGELAVAIGNPLGSLGGTVTSGIISALDREITIDGQTLHLLQTSAAINPGNSGGGLFNEKGELIGIVNAKSSGAGIEGLGFAIPINTAKEVITDLIENGYVTGKVQLGVSLLKIADEQTAMMYRVSEPGVYIAQVTANSDAYYAGLQVGDRIQSINGKAVEETADVKDIVSASSVGDTLKLQIVRGTNEQTVEITLTEYNSNINNFVRQ